MKTTEGELKDNKDYHPGGYTPEMKKEQIKELLSNYGRIEYFWFDTAQGDGGLIGKICSPQHNQRQRRTHPMRIPAI